jgi:probable F420-dependent oxidoreductase
LFGARTWSIVIAGSATRHDVAMTELGTLGVWWANLGSASAQQEIEAVKEIERLGYSTFWFGESQRNKDAMAHAGVLLQATSKINVASGIASIYNRDPTATKSGAYYLADASDGRFVLGLGVSHAPAVTRRGADYGKPVSTMRAYLDEMDAAEYQPPQPENPPPVLLAALRSRMLQLAAQRTQGAHPYLTTPDHTTRARATLGQGPLLAPEQGFVIEEDPGKAREIARAHLKYYAVLPNYVNSWREDGFTDEDFADDLSDRLVDALVVHGDVGAVKTRIQQHLDAGADHVCIQPVTTDLERGMGELEKLSPNP